MGTPLVKVETSFEASNICTDNVAPVVSIVPESSNPDSQLASGCRQLYVVTMIAPSRYLNVGSPILIHDLSSIVLRGYESDSVNEAGRRYQPGWLGSYAPRSSQGC